MEPRRTVERPARFFAFFGGSTPKPLKGKVRRVLPRQAGDFLNAQKVTKNAPEGGIPPLGIPPFSVEVPAQLSGVLDTPVRRFL